MNPQLMTRTFREIGGLGRVPGLSGGDIAGAVAPTPPRASSAAAPDGASLRGSARNKLHSPRRAPGRVRWRGLARYVRIMDNNIIIEVILKK